MSGARNKAGSETRPVTTTFALRPMTDADLTQLTTDLTTLMNSYQALLYSMAKMQNLSIMDYLK